jgi:cellulose synthase/poly-beta-1,6-N-acetylglucosamine synthase-like glycosyltransferase
MNLVYIVATCVLSVLYAWTLYNIPILAVGVRHMRRRPDRKGERVFRLPADELPMVSVIVPVKDEERVVGRLLRALLRLDYPLDKMDIIIVEDGSVDGTVQICAECARRYPDQVRLLNQSTSNGKPSALNYALKHVAGEIVAVFDADNVPEPDVLMRAVRYFEDESVAAVQGRSCSINADENMLTKFLSYEQEVQFEAYYRGKDVLSLFVPMSGSCQFFRRQALEDVGGWDEESLAEDMEMAVRLTDKGHRIRYAPDVRSWQESPASLTQLFKQRLRWFRGTMEVGLKFGSLVEKIDRRRVDAEITLAGPYAFIPCLVGYLITAYSLLVALQPATVSTIMADFTSLVTVFLLLIVGIALIYVTKPRKMSNVLWLPFIYAYWSIQNFVALYALIQIVFRRPRKWTKTVKNGITCSFDFEKRLVHDPNQT